MLNRYEGKIEKVGMFPYSGSIPTFSKKLLCLHVGCSMYAMTEQRLSRLSKERTIKVKFESVWARKNKAGCIEQGNKHLVGGLELTDADLETVCGGGGGSQSPSSCPSRSYPDQSTPPGQSMPEPSGNSTDYSSSASSTRGNTSDGGYTPLVPSGFQIIVNVIPGSSCSCCSY